MEVGATWTSGQVIFYNRSVRVQGEVHATESSLSGCRYTKATVLGITKQSAIACNETKPFQLDFPADVLGGAAYADVSFWDYRGDRPDLELRSQRIAR
ncbi:hypothetical protein [Kribbella sp. NPDC049584]|uniref:hypothetical protein n=1 Tax=Kribbella sp. NPDC049584 TaxID=3154833 RepID=UPI00342C8499